MGQVSDPFFKGLNSLKSSMPTTCDIDDPQSVEEAKSCDFDALLRDLAREYRRVKETNAKLLARIDHGLDQKTTGKRPEIDAAKSYIGPRDTEECPSREATVQDSSDALSQPMAALPSNGSGSQENTSAWTVAPSQPMVALPHTGRDLPIPQLHYLWTQSRETLAGIRKSATKSTVLKLGVGALRGCSSLTDNVCMQRFIVGPNSVKRMIWDTLSILVLGMDVVMVPLIAFDISETPALKNLSLICTYFWTFDMLASFLTGFHVEGTVEMRPRKVFQNYLRGWFPFDLVVVLLDWFLLVSALGMADLVGLFRLSRILRFARVFRAIRLLRLVRMVKLPALLDDMAEYMRFDSLSTAFRVMRSLITIGVANHFLACGWYAVGKASTPSWITELDDDGRDLAFRYVTALHWSLTQFTPASMEIHPRGFPERVYSICVLFLALVVFSSFVSSITNAMNHLRQVNAASSKQKRNLRRYIQENKLSLELGNRITAFAKQLRMGTRARVHEKEVDVFKVLPESLRLQLHWEVYVPVLSHHSFFFHCAELFELFVLELCQSAVHEKSLMTGQELFRQNDEANEMYICISGSLGYYQGQVDIRTSLVNQDDWCCEVSLWLVWAYQGQLAALTHAEMVALDARFFRKIVSQSIALFDLCKSYALAFQERLSHLSNTESLDVLCDHDSTLEMSQHAFESVRQQQQDDAKDVFAEKPSLRTWHTLSLVHMSTPPALQSQARSNTH
mmetsp:Transcript_27724/g.52163  ORF Transcript_27724/g.52163 Transcript_27724/m.52163 type:complete len:734 (+) Transcript_27724:3-2204(+)